MVVGFIEVRVLVENVKGPIENLATLSPILSEQVYRGEIEHESVLRIHPVDQEGLFQAFLEHACVRPLE